MIQRTSCFTAQAKTLARKYAGMHIAIVDDKVVAVGPSRLAVYKRAEKGIPRNKKIGVYYFPRKKEILTAL